MSQVSLLLIESPQAIDIKSVNKNSTDVASEDKSVFSELVEQHYDSGKDGKEAKNNGNKALKSTETTNKIEKDPLLVSKSSESDQAVVSEVNANGEIHINISDVQTILKMSDPIEYNQSSDLTEQLLAFLTDAEKILTVSKDVIYVENTQNTEQSETKIKEQIINAQVLIPVKFEENALMQQYNESSEMEGESVSELVGVKVNGVKVDETKTDGTKTDIVVASKENNTDITLNIDEILDEPANVKKKIQASTIEVGIEPGINDNKATKTIKNTSQVDLTSLNNVVRREVIGLATISELEQAEKTLENDKNSLNSLTTSQQINQQAIGLEDELNTKSNEDIPKDKKSTALPSNNTSINMEQSVVERQKNMMGVITNDPVLASTTNSHVDKTSQVIDNTQTVTTRSVNQSTVSFMTQNSAASDQHEQAGEQQRDQNANLSLLAEEESNEDVLVKAKQDAVTPSTKAVINPLIDNQRQPEISRANNIRAEQSYESVMNNISSDIVQTQKSAVIVQNEAISIYQKDFANAVKDKVMIMMNQKLQNIEIQLDPAELGSVNVRVKLQHEQAVVSFMVQHQQTKEALEQNMDKLKHMLNENGIDVSDANIEQQEKQSTNKENAHQQDESNHQKLFTDNGQEQNVEVNQHKLVKASSTGVDYYA